MAYEGKDTPCKNCPCAKVFSDGGTHKARRNAKNGIRVSITASPLKDAKGNIISAIESVRQIEREILSLVFVCAEYFSFKIWHPSMMRLFHRQDTSVDSAVEQLVGFRFDGVAAANFSRSKEE